MGKRPKKSKKADMKEDKKDFVPGTETEEQFEKVLSLLSDWMKAGIVDFELDSDGDIQFNLPREMSKLLGTQVPRDLTHKKVVAIIQTEIPALISAGLEKKPEHRLRFLMPEELHDKIDTIVKRSEKAIVTLINKRLKERIFLRRTTPSYVIDEIRSMESTYHIESEKGEKVNVPHLSLEFSFAKPRSGQMLVMDPKQRTVSFSRKDDIRVAVDLHKDDMKDLVKKLSKIAEDTGE